MSDFIIAQLGSSHIDPTFKTPLTQVVNQGVTDDTAEPFGELPTYSSLGLTALPFPKTSAGWCEGFVAKDAAGLDGVILGGRDTRCASIYGEMQPGDTIVHSTGDKLASMVMCKETRKQVVLRTKDSASKDMMVVLDGTDDKVTVSAFKCIFEMTRGRIDIGAQGASEASIIIDGEAGSITLNAGTLYLGGTALALNGVCWGLAATPSTSVFTQIRSRVRRWLLGLLAEFQLGIETSRVSL